MKALEDMGRRVQERFADGAGAERREQQRARLIASQTSPEMTSFPWRGLAIAASAAVVAVVLVLASLWPREEESGPRTRSGQAVEQGSWVEGQGEAGEAIVFPDASTVEVSPGSRLRVAELSPSSVRLALESGTLDISVQHREERSWFFLAGPYEVKVVGTEFSLAWEPVQGDLEVRVKRGVVVVSGGALGPEAVRISRGNTLHADRLNFELRGGPGETSTLPDAPPPKAQPELPREPSGPPDDHGTHSKQEQRAIDTAPGVESRPVPRPSSPSVRRESPVEDWWSRVQANDYRGAAKLAKDQGIELLAARESAERLLALADSLRLAGETADAGLVLERLHARFPSTASAHAAAFRLGRIAADQGRFMDARRWFEQVLEDDPSGTYAAEALGRLIDVSLTLNDASAAQHHARSYLDKYPQGPYRSVAEAQLPSGETP